MRRLESLGAIGRICLVDLPFLKIQATEIQAEALQRSSRFAVSKERRIKLKYMPSAEDLLTTSSDLWLGAPSVNGSDRYMLFSSDAPVFGGSQEKIGKHTPT